MAIRFKPDLPSNNGGDNRGGGRGGRNNNAMIMAIIMFVFRYPKIGIPLVIIGLIFFAITGGPSSLQSDSSQDNIYNMGCEIDQERYDASQVYAALSPSSSKYSLPKAVSLRRFTPTPQNQGEQGSCVGWASAYAARTTLEAATVGGNPNSMTFSPSFLYNQIGLSHAGFGPRAFGCGNAASGLPHFVHQGSRQSRPRLF